VFSSFIKFELEIVEYISIIVARYDDIKH